MATALIRRFITASFAATIAATSFALLRRGSFVYRLAFTTSSMSRRQHHRHAQEARRRVRYATHTPRAGNADEIRYCH